MASGRQDSCLFACTPWKLEQESILWSDEPDPEYASVKETGLQA